VHRIRGLDGLKALARAVTVDRIDLGFVDLLSCEGALGYPAAGPKEELFWRRSVIQTTEPPRSRTPVVDRTARNCVGAVFAIVPPRPPPDPTAVEGVLAQIGTTPRGTPWDCGACGFATCREFAAVAVAGRTTLRLCPMYLDRRAKESQEEAARDFLTGLATRAVADGRGEAEVERAKRSQERFSVLFVDLDRFKAINDGYGHPAGDEVLRGVAAEIAGAVRASDLASRYAGDEFLVILPRTDAMGAVRVAEAQRSGVERTGQRLGFAQGLVTVSIGIAVWDPGKPESWRDLLERADQAMFAAKARGRNQIFLIE
jgi:diguanylate cyclase (GGDEF)-like protein